MEYFKDNFVDDGYAFDLEEESFFKNTWKHQIEMHVGW